MPKVVKRLVSEQVQELISTYKQEQQLKEQKSQMLQMQQNMASYMGIPVQQVPNPAAPQNPALTFAEQYNTTQNDHSMPKIGGLLKVQNANLALIALGVVASTASGDRLAGLIPAIGRYATIIAGGLILMFVRNGPLRDIGAGILIGGLADLIRSYTGGMFGMGSSNMMAEDMKPTYGGGEGVYPTQPDRRTFA